LLIDVRRQAVLGDPSTISIEIVEGARSVRPHISLVWIVIAPVGIGIAVVADSRTIIARVTVTRSVISVSRSVVARTNGCGRSRSAHDAKADRGPRVNTATVVAATIVIDISHVREGGLLVGCHG